MAIVYQLCADPECLCPQLQAYERLLAEYPEWIGKVVLIQVTSPSPTDSVALGTKVSELVDSINVSQIDQAPFYSRLTSLLGQIWKLTLSPGSALPSDNQVSTRTTVWIGD